MDRLINTKTGGVTNASRESSAVATSRLIWNGMKRSSTRISAKPCKRPKGSAGMGSVVKAMRHMTPGILLPRRFESGKHTTDHQMATARSPTDKPGVFIAWHENNLVGKIAEAEA